MRIYLICLTALFCFISGLPAYAQQKLGLPPVETDTANTKSTYGLAMQGEPKYDENSPHLAYANPDAPKGGTLRQSAIGTFDTINPYAIKGTAAEGLSLIYDTLMTRVWDEPFTLYPLIAEKVEVSANRSGLTIHINPLAKFQDGSNITAKDVVFSYNILKEKGRPNMRKVYGLVGNIEAIDELTVKMTFKPGYDRETIMILAKMPVLSKDWWEDRDFEETLLEMPVTSGPYEISGIQPGNRLVYSRVEDYWAQDLLPNKGHFNFDKIIYDYFRDDTVAFEAFLKGSFDLRRESDIGKWMESYNNTPNITKKEFDHDRPPMVSALIFNLRRPPFDDIKVRQALSLAFDAQWVKENVYRGEYERTYSYFPNTPLSADIEPIGADMSRRARLREASRLLKEAGWQIKNNVLQKNGERLSFDIILSQPEDEKIVLAFTRNLKRLGIDARPRTLDSAGFQNRLMGYDYDMILHHWINSLSPGTEQMLYWGCDSAKTPGRLNYSGICNPLIERTAGYLPEVYSYEELLTQTKVLDKMLINQYLSIPLFHSEVDRIAVRDNIAYPETTPMYGPVVETWWDSTQQNSGN